MFSLLSQLRWSEEPNKLHYHNSTGCSRVPRNPNRDRDSGTRDQVLLGLVGEHVKLQPYVGLVYVTSRTSRRHVVYSRGISIKEWY
jgi:hypothetical protein